MLEKDASTVLKHFFYYLFSSEKNNIYSKST